MDRDSKIFVAGASGLIGSAISTLLVDRGYTNIVSPSHAELELKDRIAVANFFDQHAPTHVFMCAGRVGGIIENTTFPADFILENLSIQSNMVSVAIEFGVERFILFGSSCMYPRECPQPMAEDELFTGLPEPTSMSYAVSKMAGIQLCLAANQQYQNQSFIPVIPNSVFGPNDNFSPTSGHVLSVLIRKFHEAKMTGSDVVNLWGSGNPKREFVYSSDVANACVALMSHEGEMDLPLNIGAGFDMTIRELAQQVSHVVGFSGSVDWDQSKPDGAPRKFLDSARMHELGWNAKVEFEAGLIATYRWFLENKA